MNNPRFFIRHCYCFANQLKATSYIPLKIMHGMPVNKAFMILIKIRGFYKL